MASGLVADLSGGLRVVPIFFLHYALTTKVLFFSLSLFLSSPLLVP
jgi:hypothetical protein